MLIIVGQVQTDVIYKRNMKQDFPDLLGLNPHSTVPTLLTTRASHFTRSLGLNLTLAPRPDLKIGRKQLRLSCLEVHHKLIFLSSEP